MYSMLPKASRLSSEEITELKRIKASRTHSPLCVVEKYPSNRTQFAVVVSKKVAKTAVERNRVRRMFYSLLETITFSPGAYIIYVKPAACTHTTTSLTKELREFFETKL